MDKLDLPKINNDIARFWKTNDIFKKSMEKSKNKPEFVYYDGPPFATGKPHYGHVLASMIKDVVPRYKTQMGFYVERRFNWDVHGLPIEFEIEKRLGIKTEQQIVDYGIANYNEECRKIVMECVDSWETMIYKLGRWVDYENNRKTMDIGYMESVWWVIKRLSELGYIYEGFKVMPYSTGCHTTLSNFEAQSNYQNVLDYSLTVEIKLKTTFDLDDNVYLMVWTTTPWTLIANMACCLSPNLTYIIVYGNSKSNKVSNNKYYLISKECVSRYFQEDNYTVVKTLNRNELENIHYTPLFSYYSNDYPHAFRLLYDDYVSSEKGTGIVHIAPAFGADDNRVCIVNTIIKKDEYPPCPIDNDGCYKDFVVEYKGKYIKDIETQLVIDLKQQNKVFKSTKELHDYPYCWRSNTPLIYMVQPSIFINVSKLNENGRLNELNSEINWTPDVVGKNRFDNWLKTSQDWCISRTRYWGTPINLWTNGTERFIPGTIKELEERAGLQIGSIKDLHRHHIDHIKLKPLDFRNDKWLERVNFTCDCWLESGSLPYAQNNFKGETDTPPKYPADFIAEGLDQTRGWFYTLLVLSAALFDTIPVKNIIVNGLILAEDGSKMSKSKQNYTPIDDVFNTFGADALRMYLCSSDVVQAEPLKASEKGIKNVIQTFFLPFHNSLNFLIELIDYYETTSKQTFKLYSFNTENKLDLMILKECDLLIKKVHEYMNKYQLNKVIPLFVKFIDSISKVYIKLKKPVMKSILLKESFISLHVLFHCLFSLTSIIGPFMPFISEYYYQVFFKKFNLEQVEESIHFLSLPRSLGTMKHCEQFVTIESESSYNLLNLLNLGHLMRQKLPFSYKRPLKHLSITSTPEIIKNIKNYQDYLMTELNLLDVDLLSNDNDLIVYQVVLNYKEVPKEYKDSIKELNKYIKENQKSVYDILKSEDRLVYNEIELNSSVFTITKKINKRIITSLKSELSESFHNELFILKANLEYNDEINYQFELRQLVRTINEYRKNNGLSINIKSKGTIYIIKDTVNEKTINEFSRNFKRLYIDLLNYTKTDFSLTEYDCESTLITSSFNTSIKVIVKAK
jgi:isoleucyl-tRNA synthetase